MFRDVFVVAKNWFTKLSKIVFVIGILIFVINLFYILSKPASSQPNGKQTTLLELRQEELYRLFEHEQFKSDEGQVTVWAIKNFLCGIVGEACGDTLAEARANDSLGAVGAFAGLAVKPIAYPPASGFYEVQTTLANAGFIPKTYAAEGIGFAQLKPYRNFWLLSRNIAFMLLVLVTVIIGFMIMFRTQINAQLVISIENALPRIVVVMILIPLSFAIAGFLVDLMYVLIALSINMLSELNVGHLTPDNANNVVNKYTDAWFSDLWPFGVNGYGDIYEAGHAFARIFPAEVSNGIKVLLSGLVIRGIADGLIDAGRRTGARTQAGRLVRGTVNRGRGIINILQALAGSLPIAEGIANASVWVIILLIGLYLTKYVPGIVLGIVIFATIFIFLWKTLLLILTTYINVLLLIVFSPLIIILDIFPGQGNFGNWMKRLSVELFTFPLVVILTLFGHAIIETHNVVGDSFRPPFLSGFSPNDFGVVIGLAVILLIPQLVPKIKEKLGVKPFGVNWQEAFFGAAGKVVGAAGAYYLAGGTLGAGFLRLPTGNAHQLQAKIQSYKGMADKLSGGGKP